MSIIIIRYVPHIPIRILCRAVKKLCGKGTDIDIFCIGVIIYNGDLVDDTIQNNGQCFAGVKRLLGFYHPNTVLLEYIKQSGIAGLCV